MCKKATEKHYALTVTYMAHSLITRLPLYQGQPGEVINKNINTAAGSVVAFSEFIETPLYSYSFADGGRRG